MRNIKKEISGSVPATLMEKVNQQPTDRQNRVSVPTQKQLKPNGFTLIEIIIAIALLFMVVAAVFYFYSNLMDNQGKIREKYALLRISREFIDSYVFNEQASIPGMARGQRETEGFVLQWQSFAIEEPREVLFTSGMSPYAQLKRVNLLIFKKETKKQVLELNFLVNAYSAPGR